MDQQVGEMKSDYTGAHGPVECVAELEQGSDAGGQVFCPACPRVHVWIVDDDVVVIEQECAVECIRVADRYCQHEPQ